MQALASEPQQLFWRQALAQPSKPVPQPSIALEEPPVVEEMPAVEEHAIAEESAPPVEEPLEQPPVPAPAPIKTALQGWLPQWDGPQIDRLAS